MRKGGLLLAGLLLANMVVMPVNAADVSLTSSGSNGSSSIEYTANTQAFTINIPAVVTVDTQDTDFSVTSSLMNIRPDEYVSVDVTCQNGLASDGTFTLNRQNVPNGKAVATLKTTLVNSNKTLTSAQTRVAYFEDSAAPTTNLSGATTVRGLPVTAQTEAGDYQGILTFKVTKNSK